MEVETILLSIVIGLSGWIVARINSMSRECHDLHRWHAPNDQGQQTWKDKGPLLARLDTLIELLKEHMKMAIAKESDR